MFLAPVFALALAAIPSLAQDVPIVYNSAHNATPIVGTWSSGSKQVVTGAGFASPANMSFTYPAVTGVSYAFSEDGYYEVARYRFNGNGPSPNCITGVLNWHHGEFTLNPNGSITLNPYNDGYQQIQDPCAAETNFIEGYNHTELYSAWQIFQDQNDGPKLHLFQADGTPVAPLFQVYSTPNMLPTRLLRNVTVTVTGDSQSLFASNTGSRRGSSEGVVGLVTGVVAAGVASMLL